MEAEKELVQIINRQIDAGFAESIPILELQEKLTVFINHLIQNDFERLVAILYKVDVDENRLKNILKAGEGKNAAGIIADLIIEREKQKIETRKQYSGKK
jgi:hypothetical protein